jgi:polar amino acid transport system substrate-binding protein
MTGFWTNTARSAVAGLAFCAAAFSSAQAQDASSDILKNVLDRGVVRVGECMGLAPFGTYNANNEPEGYDIDIANELGATLGVKVEIVNVDPAARIPSLETGKVDVVFCDTTRTLDRLKRVAFTDTYNVTGTVILSNKETPVNSLEELNGKTVAIAKGTPYADVVKKSAPDAEVIAFNSPADIITAVKQGQAAAAIENSAFLNYMAKSDPSLHVTSESVIELYYNSFAIPQGQPNWLAYLNEFIFQLNTSGKNKELYKKWFGVEPPFALNPQF